MPPARVYIMTTNSQRPIDELFEPHDDVATEETEMMIEGSQAEDETAATRQANREEEDAEEGDEEEEDDESSDDELVDRSVQADMDKLQRDFPGFRDEYRLIKRIGEGRFSASTAIDILSRGSVD